MQCAQRGEAEGPSSVLRTDLKLDLMPLSFHDVHKLLLLAMCTIPQAAKSSFIARISRLCLALSDRFVKRSGANGRFIENNYDIISWFICHKFVGPKMEIHGDFTYLLENLYFLGSSTLLAWVQRSFWELSGKLQYSSSNVN